jgi:hypothetical protein
VEEASNWKHDNQGEVSAGEVVGQTWLFDKSVFGHILRGRIDLHGSSRL